MKKTLFVFSILLSILATACSGSDAAKQLADSFQFPQPTPAPDTGDISIAQGLNNSKPFVVKSAYIIVDSFDATKYNVQLYPDMVSRCSRIENSFVRLQIQKNEIEKYYFWNSNDDGNLPQFPLFREDSNNHYQSVSGMYYQLTKQSDGTYAGYVSIPKQDNWTTDYLVGYFIAELCQ